MPKETKANAATAEARVNKVYEYLIAGLTRYQIQQAAYGEKSKDKDLFAGITERQLDRYISDANGLLSQEAEFVRVREFGRAIARMNTIFAASLRLQDYQRAIAAAKELHALLGLYAPVKSELKLTSDGQIALAQLLTELEKRNVSAGDMFNKILVKLVEENA